MSGKRIGYIRVSTADQNPDRQLDGISLDKKFIEKASGKTIYRPQLEMLMDYAREDDVIFVHSMDRLARNVKDLIHIVESLIKKGVQVHFFKENLIFNGKDSALSKLLLMIIGSVAEFEHALIVERQQEGIRLAKKAGKYTGAPTKLTPELRESLRKEISLTRKSKSQIAQELGISRFSLYKYMEKLGIDDKRQATDKEHVPMA